MAKTDLGEKQTCPNCSAKFYDLRKRPATCPKCQNAFDPDDESLRVKRGRARIAAHDPAYEDDEDEVDAKAKKKGDDEDDEEEAAEPAEAEAEEETTVLADDEDDATVATSDDEIPEGFSEGEADLEEDTAEDDDSVPLLEDEEEFPEDEIGDLPADDDDDGAR